MSTTSIVLTVLAVIAAIVLIAAIAWVAHNKRNQHRHVEADKIREAQASGLHQQAAAHRSEAATSRDQLNEQWDRADTMDPAPQRPETSRTADRREHQDH
jgi:Flp pilus assembly protein TadB